VERGEIKISIGSDTREREESYCAVRLAKTPALVPCFLGATPFATLLGKKDSILSAKFSAAADENVSFALYCTKPF